MRARLCVQTVVLSLFIGAAWIAPATAATNLVTNGAFDTNRSSWTDPGTSANITTTAWNRDDARGSAASGSFAVTNSNPFGSISASGPSQCVAVTSGGKYGLGGKIEVPGGQSGSGVAYVVLTFRGATNCLGSVLGDNLFSPPVSAASGRFTSVAVPEITAPDGAQSVTVTLIVFKSATTTAPSFTAQFDDVVLATIGGCIPSQTVLCLDGGRFAVNAIFTAPGADAANAQAVALTDDTGYLWFFSANNVEVTLKVLNACAISPFHWVFVSGLTNVQVSIAVKDTLTGAIKTYNNPQSQNFLPQYDTSAFACP